MFKHKHIICNMDWEILSHIIMCSFSLPSHYMLKSVTEHCYSFFIHSTVAFLIMLLFFFVMKIVSFMFLEYLNLFKLFLVWDVLLDKNML